MSPSPLLKWTPSPPPCPCSSQAAHLVWQWHIAERAAELQKDWQPAPVYGALPRQHVHQSHLTAMAWPTLSAEEESRKDEAFSIYMLTHSRSLSPLFHEHTHIHSNVHMQTDVCVWMHTQPNISTSECMCIYPSKHTDMPFFCKWHSQHFTHHS